ncbi:MAG: magnesium transporter MgtE N-terminal domain-containing protein [Acidimicrobiales bacterium]
MTRPFPRLPSLPRRARPDAPDSGGSGGSGPEPTPSSHTLHRPRPLRHRTQRLLATRAVRDTIVSLAGVVGRPVRNQGGEEIGRLVDVVCRWSDAESYPPVTGLVVKVGRRVAFVDGTAIAAIDHTGVRLNTARVDLRDFEPREGEVTLAKQVLDFQLVDVDGVKVIRASDLYLAPVAGGYRLVGVDVSAQSLLRRLGPTRWRPLATPDRVIDWGAIQPFGDTAQGAAPDFRLRTTNAGLERLRPGELADLLEDLMRPERQELLDSLSPEEAADALEEMDPEELASLLREEEPARAAELIANMEPDEAVDALRDLNRDERDEVLGAMPLKKAAPLVQLLAYPEDEAGGFMTNAFVTARVSETVTELVARLSDPEECPDELDAVALVDDDGVFVWDLPLLQLLVTPGTTRLGELVGESEPVGVDSHARVNEVAERLVEARRLSVVVVEHDKPVGRILADDVLDALTPERGRLHFPRLLQ